MLKLFTTVAELELLELESLVESELEAEADPDPDPLSILSFVFLLSSRMKIFSG